MYGTCMELVWKDLDILTTKPRRTPSDILEVILLVILDAARLPEIALEAFSSWSSSWSSVRRRVATGLERTLELDPKHRNQISNINPKCRNMSDFFGIAHFVRRTRLPRLKALSTSLSCAPIPFPKNNLSLPYSQCPSHPTPSFSPSYLSSLFSQLTSLTSRSRTSRATRTAPSGLPSTQTRRPGSCTRRGGRREVALPL